jgi:NADH-quinone oxidoreductase subunit C
MYDKIIEKMKSLFGEFIQKIIQFRGELTFIVDKTKIKEICQFLKDDEMLSFELLADICGLDRNTKTERFEVVYNLWSVKNKIRIRLRAKVDEEDLHIQSVTPVWESANFYEREAYDLFGIIFDDHPDLRRIYMPEEFEYYPLRKDFPLTGIPDSIPLPRRS